MTKTVWSYYDETASAKLGWALRKTWHGWYIVEADSYNLGPYSEVKSLASKGHPLAKKAIEIISKPFRIELSQVPASLAWATYEQLLGKQCNIGTILGVTRGKRQAENQIYLVINTKNGDTLDYQVTSDDNH